MQNIEIELKQKFDFFEKQKLEGLAHLQTQVDEINQKLSEFIDQIYDDNYNIQKYIFNYHKRSEKKFQFYEKKIEWLRTHLPTTKATKKKKTKAKDGLSV